jgi:hypothetical protein
MLRVPLIANGYFAAKKQAEFNIRALQQSITGDGIPVIATSSTCTFTLRDEYPHLLDVDNHHLRPHIDLATRWIWRNWKKAIRSSSRIAIEGGLSHTVPYGENGLDALYPGSAATDSRAGTYRTGFTLLRDRDLRL